MTSATLARQVIVGALEGTLSCDDMYVLGVRVDRPCVVYTLELGCRYGEGVGMRLVICLIGLGCACFKSPCGVDEVG